MIGGVADGLKKSRDTLVGLQQDLETAVAPRGWAGSAAKAANERLRREIARLRRIVAAISAVFTGAADTEVAIEIHQRAMDEVTGLADWYEFTITDAGEVVSVSESAPEGLLDMLDHRAQVKLDLERRIEQILRDAADSDAALADIMSNERNLDSHPTTVAMDLHNNEVGRRIAVENPDASHEELRHLVEQAVRGGETVVVGTDERLDYSDQVDLGDTRATSSDHPWPAGNPERAQHRVPGEPDAYPERGY